MFDRTIFFFVNAWLYRKHWRVVKRLRRRLGRWPNIAFPKCYAERMLWRKTVDHNPLFVTLVDKLAAKEYVRARSPELSIPCTLWEGSDADAIPAEVLRQRVWVKANHGCDYNYQVTGDALDRRELKAKADAWLGSVFGGVANEWAYSKVKPRLFVEQTISPADGRELWEFEIRVAAGRFVLGSMVRNNKRPGVYRVFLDEAGQPVHAPGDTPDSVIRQPDVGHDYVDAFREASRHALKIGAGIDYARIDFYWDGDRVHAGEVTIYPASGSTTIVNPDVSRKTLSTWRLENADFLVRPQPWPASLYADALRRRIAKDESNLGEP